MGQVIGERVLYRWDGNENMRFRQKLLPGRKIEDGLIRGLATFKKIVYQM